MKHAKTTTLGILTILAVLSKAALEFAKTGTIANLGEIVAAVTAGVGLIAAADGK